MDLQIQSALIGEAFDGQRIQVNLKNGITYDFTCRPHKKYHLYVWRLDEQTPASIEELFPDLKATWKTTWTPSWYTVYVDQDHLVATNCPLYLRAVPEGIGSASKESSVCLGVVQGISIT